MKKFRFLSSLLIALTLTTCCFGPLLQSAQAQNQEAPIFAAIQKKDAAQLREILADAAQLNATDGNGDTPLHRVLRDNDSGTAAARKEMVALLLEKGASVQARNRAGQTPLHLAAAGYEEISREIIGLLLDKNADVKARDRDGNTPLHYANQSQTSALLLAKGADVNAVNTNGGTPLHRSVYAGNGPLEVAGVLLAAGADPNLQDANGDLPIHLHLRRRGYQVNAALLEKSDLLLRDSTGLTAAQQVLLSGNPALLEAFAARHPKLDDTTAVFDAAARNDAASLEQQLQAKPHLAFVRLSGGQTPLHLSARWQALNCVELLLSKKADPNARDTSANTPLHETSFRVAEEKRATQLQIIQALLKAGADPNAVSFSGNSPLHQSLFSDKKEATLALLDGGANPNIRNWRGQTALQTVATESQARALDIIAPLIAKGAEINALGSNRGDNLNGSTALALLVADNTDFEEKKMPMLAALLQNNARLDIQNDHGDTALHLAARRQKTAVLQQLLAAPAPAVQAALAVRNLQGITPLGTAIAAKRDEAAALLRAAGGNE